MNVFVLSDKSQIFLCGFVMETWLILRHQNFFRVSFQTTVVAFPLRSAERRKNLA